METTEQEPLAAAAEKKRRFAPSTRDIEDLVSAHYRRDEKLFSLRVKMLANRAGGDTEKRWLRQITTFTALEMLPLAARDLMVPTPEHDLADLIFVPRTLEELRMLIREWRARVHLLGKGLRPRSAALFSGPPGNGKTSAAAAIAKELGVQAYTVRLPTLIDSHMGVTGQNLDKVFSVLRAGHIVVIDEIDAVSDRRTTEGSGAARESNRITNTLNTLFDQGFDGLLVATTNRADMLDDALLRRFDLRVTFPGPDSAQLAELCGRLARQYGIKGDWVRARESVSFDAATKHMLDLARAQAIAEFEREQA